MPISKEELKGLLNRPTRVIHKLCGGILFWYDGVPKANTSLNPAKTILNNGAHPNLGDPIVCSTCQYDVFPNGMEWLIEKDVSNELH